MKNVSALVNRAVTECAEVGIQVGYIDDVLVDYKSKRTWGTCQLRYGKYTILISSRLLADDIDDKATMDTVMHEVLHTVNGCMNHGKKWKYLASIVNRKYGYNVKRCNSMDEKEIPNTVLESTYKYKITCKGCGATSYSSRMGKRIKIMMGYYGYGTFCRCSRCNGIEFEVQENY